MEVDVHAHQPVVIDTGGAVIKAGFAGEDRPREALATVVGRPKHVRVMPGGALEGSSSCVCLWVFLARVRDAPLIHRARLPPLLRFSFVGSKVAEHRGALLLSHPVDHGRVRDWPDMELLWRAAYESGALGATASAHPLLLTQPPSASRSSREETATVFFESLRVPALFLAPTTTLALYATGRTTGLVLECGDGVTAAAPIYEGFALPHASMRADFGGGDVTDTLAALLRRSGAAFATTAERETVRSIKETSGTIAVSAAAADAFAAVGAASSGSAAADDFLLPDGSRLSVGSDVGRAFEVLFRPALAGLEAPGCADLVSCALARTDLDLRRALLGSIILTGGTTAARGFAARLLGDVRAAAPPDAHVRVWAPADRKLLPWIGGSILASLSTFRSTWVSREEWEEEGPRCLAKFG